MHPLRFGLKLSQNATIDTLTTIWRIADDSGFDHCWNMDHFASLGGDDTLDIFEAWTLLAGMAARTTPHADRLLGHRQHLPAPGGAGEGRGHRGPPLRRTAGVRHRRGLGGERAHDARPPVRQRPRPRRLARGGAADHPVAVDEPRTTFTGKHYLLADAVAEPKPVQTPHPPIWIGGVGRRRTLRMAAEHAAVWNAPGGTPEEVGRALRRARRALRRHRPGPGRDPPVGADPGARRRGRRSPSRSRGFVAVGVTEIILIVAADPVAQAERVAGLLPELREPYRAGSWIGTAAGKAPVRACTGRPRPTGAAPARVRRRRGPAATAGRVRRVRARSPTTQASARRAARRPAGRGTSSSLR